MNSSRLQVASLMSGLGALILGFGLGVWAGRFFGGTGWPFILSGALLHGLGMFATHRLQDDSAQPRWSKALYWLCWLLLGGVVTYIILRLAKA